MFNSAEALIGFVVWAMFLIIPLGFARLQAVREDRIKTIAFDPYGKDLNRFGQRATRAYANSLENLAIPTSLLLYAIATQQTAITDGLACWALLARIVQSSLHLISLRIPVQLTRAGFFYVQYIIFSYWSCKFLLALYS